MARHYNDAREKVSAAIVEFVQTMPVVRNFDTGSDSLGRYQRALAAYRELLARWYRESGNSVRLTWAILSPLPTLAAVLWLGLICVGGGDLDPVRWLAVLLLCTGMAEAVMPMMMLRHMIDKVRLSIARIQNVMTAPLLAEPAPGAERMPQDASVTFQDVSFRYGPDEPQVLSGISFTAAPGTVTALVGPSGSGKTTLTRLILRHADPAQGQVLIGGADLRQIPKAELRKSLSVVFQDVHLFNDSVMANIRMAPPRPPMPKSMPPRVPPNASISSSACRRAGTRLWAISASACRGASVSASRLRGPC